jgi:AcrR family transcriptional regulator
MLAGSSASNRPPWRLANKRAGTEKEGPLWPTSRTKATILKAAQHLFADQGYERATVRDIAARAAIDPAMVIRYFGSKDQ